MSTENIVQIAESTINNVVRVTRLDNEKKIITFAKIGDRNQPRIEIKGMIKR